MRQYRQRALGPGLNAFQVLIIFISVICKMSTIIRARLRASEASKHQKEISLPPLLSPRNSFFLFFKFIFERDRACAGEGQGERETQNPKQAPRLRAVGTEPDAGLEPTNREIVT